MNDAAPVRLARFIGELACGSFNLGAPCSRACRRSAGRRLLLEEQLVRHGQRLASGWGREDDGSQRGAHALVEGCCRGPTAGVVGSLGGQRAQLLLV